MAENVSFLEVLQRFVPGGLWEALFLRRAEQAARRVTPEQEKAVHRLVAAADRRVRAAELLSSDDEVAVVALSVAGEGAKLMMAAVLASRGGEADLRKRGDAAFVSEIRALVERGELPVPSFDLDVVRQGLESDAPIANEDLKPVTLATRRLAFDHCSRWMRQQVETRTVSAIRVQRKMRLGGVVAALAATLALGSYCLFSPSNLAYRKPVTMSSNEPNQPPGTGPAGAAPAKLVDGESSAPFDVVTRWEVRPWAQIDLLKTYKISRVVVRVRSDCCTDSLLPIVVEVSADGQDYKEIGRRTTPVVGNEPWTIGASSVRGRYVRVRKDANEPGNIALRELEVYGG